MRITFDATNIAAIIHEWMSRNMPQLNLTPADIDVYSAQAHERDDDSDPVAVIEVDGRPIAKPYTLSPDPWEALQELGVTEETAKWLKAVCECDLHDPEVASRSRDQELALEVGEQIVQAIKEAKGVIA